MRQGPRTETVQYQGPGANRFSGLWPLWLFAFTLSVYLATTGGSMATDSMTYEVAKNMVEHGSVAMSYNVHQMEAHRGVDGRYYSPYGLGHPVFSVPFYLLGRAAEERTGLCVGKPEALRKAGVVLGSAVAAALTVWLACLFAWRLVGDARAAAKTALVLGFGTLLWPYAKFGFNQPLAGLCLLAGTYAAWMGGREQRPGAVLLSGAGVGAALLVRHELALGAIPIAAFLLLETRWNWRLFVRRALVLAIPVAAAMLLTLYYNHTRFGNPLDTGYLRDETATFGSFCEGLVGLLVSPGRSLFLYSPVVAPGVAALIGLSRRDRAAGVLLGGQVLVLLVFYSTLEYWDADRSYGPRYLVPALPYLILPLAFWIRDPADPLVRRLLPILVAASVLVQLPGVLVDFSKVGYTPEVGFHSLEERRWNWEVAGLTLNARAVATLVPRNLRYLSGADEPPPVPPARGRAPEFSEQFSYSLDFWWLYLFYLGAVSAPVAVALGLVSAVIAAGCAWRLRRSLALSGSSTHPES